MAAGEIVVSGEHRELVLFRPGSDAALAVVSCWRCVFSPVGDGNVVAIWTDRERSGLRTAAPFGIFADNVALGQLVADRFLRYSPIFDGIDLTALAIEPARFAHEGDGRWYQRVVVTTGTTVVELRWWETLDRRLEHDIDVDIGPDRWRRTSLVCPCGNASISVNSRPIPGSVRVVDDDDTLNSSAVLAFSETWSQR